MPMPDVKLLPATPNGAPPPPAKFEPMAGKITRPVPPCYFTIHDTGSMRPLIVGDTEAYLAKAKIEDVKKGDIVSFENTRRGAISAHSVLEVKKSGNGETYLITKGLGNDERDPLNVSAKDFIGIVNLLPKKTTQ